MRKVEPFIDRSKRVDTLTRLAAGDAQETSAAHGHLLEALADRYSQAFLTGCKEKDSEKEGDRGRALAIPQIDRLARTSAAERQQLETGLIPADILAIF